MKIILSRKGFDSASGGAPSPIVDGRPISMPIPATRNSTTTYDKLGLGSLVERITGGRISRDHLCHNDPMFIANECWFGQCDAAQSHLANQGVGVGDTFLFFGLFANEITQERHHRIFGYLKVAALHNIGDAAPDVLSRLKEIGHAHVLGIRSANNTVYGGEGAVSSRAADRLRLTCPHGPPSRWQLPAWVRDHGLSFHGDERRWTGAGELNSVARGQEFVCDIGEDPEAHAWVDEIIEVIRS